MKFTVEVGGVRVAYEDPFAASTHFSTRLQMSHLTRVGTSPDFDKEMLMLFDGWCD
jgi:hypothetical protein